MRTIILFASLATTSIALTAPMSFAESPKHAPSAVIPPPTQLAVANTQPRPVIQFDYTPRITRLQPAPQAMPDKQKVVEQFRESYAKQNKPRLLLYVNRDLAAAQSKDKQGEPVVHSQVTAREIEEAFSLPLQDASAVFVDRQFASLSTDKEAVRKNADLAIEVLMEERGFTVENQEIRLPIMTAAAVRLSDSQIVARVTSRGLFGLDSRDPNANLTGLMLQMTPSEIAQEIAIALMRELNGAWEK